MDDVALIAKDPEEIQKMLNITEDITNQYHVELGKEKSKIITSTHGWQICDTDIC